MSGIYALLGVRESIHDIGRRISAALTARGPDGSDTFVDGDVAVGVRRLAISRPNAPARVAVDERAQWAAVLSGAIYNADSLRARHGDDGGSDAGLLPALFANGVALGDVDGPVTALAFERSTRALHVLRDRFGKRPLFIARCTRPPNAGAVVVASELKALAASGLVDIKFAGAAVDAFLRRGILEDDRPLLAGVRAAPPGHHVTLAAAEPGERKTPPAYGSRPRPLLDPLGRGGPVDDDALIERLREAALKRVPAQQQPWATVLSGDAPSTAVTALTRPPRAYAMRDESARASRAAAALGTALRVVDATPSFATLRQALWHLEQPDAFVAWDAAPAYASLAERLRADGVRVVVVGDGAHDIFLGHPWHRAHAAVEMRTPLGDAGDLLGATPGAYASTFSARGQTSRALEVWLAAARPDPFQGVDIVGELLVRDALTQDTVAIAPDKDRTGAARRQRESVAHDLRTWPLRILDRVLAAHGIEARYPFLDDSVAHAAVALAPPELDNAVAWRRAARTKLNLAADDDARARAFAGPVEPEGAQLDEITDALASAPSPPVLVRQQAWDYYAVRRSPSARWRLAVLEICARHLASARAGGGAWSP